MHTNSPEPHPPLCGNHQITASCPLICLPAVLSTPVSRPSPGKDAGTTWRELVTAGP
jgi:hypothetical protein